MKKVKNFLIYILFSVVFFTCFCDLLIVNKNIKNVKCEQIYNNLNNFTLKIEKNNLDDFEIDLIAKNQKFSLKKYKPTNITKIQENIIHSKISDRIEILKFAYKNGFSKEESLIYAFPEIKEVVKDIKNKFCFDAKDACLASKNNTGTVFIEKEQSGVDLDFSALINDLFNGLIGFKGNLEVDLHFFKVNPKIKKCFYSDKMHLKGSFKTSYNSSSEARKNNIKTALLSLDGKVIMPNEEFSFNNTTGVRDEVNGYQKAKIIKNGSYYQEFGGGVCQVSTTLYVASLLANLEIIEVHPHSLPVSYVEPCFDAMVNMGSSDLIIKNNTENPIIIACSSLNDTCLINIYGVENEFDIKTISKKTEIIKDFSCEVITDYKSVGLSEPLKDGESKVVSYGKPGFKAVGILEYYKNGVLIKTKRIRENLYKPTKEVVLKS